MISWWDREVHIWRIRFSPDELLDAAKTESAVQHNKQLLGKVLVQGDANITAVDINQDGTLLLVATAFETKMFQLTLPHSSTDKLKVMKIELPVSIAARGASKAAISPNSRWICLSTGASLALVEMAARDSSAHNPSLPSGLVKLRRLQRKLPKHESFGGLGSYSRRIGNIEFSPDSRALAVGDLAGFIDTWILNGESGYAPGVSLQNGNDDVDSSSSSSDISDADKSQTGSASSWTRNPNARLIPKLHAAPLALSFSPEVPVQAENGAISGDYVLAAVTASSDILAFNILAGRLTPWSRYLKPSKLPVEYRNIRDLAKGIIWQGTRIWVYGATFMFMIDTSVDPNSEDSTAKNELELVQGTKRKRGSDTGAGDRMILGALEPEDVKMHNADTGEIVEPDVKMEDALKADGDDDSDSFDEAELSETKTTDQTLAKNGNKNNIAVGIPMKKRWWSTAQYRAILGIALLEGGAVNGAAYGAPGKLPPLEVAIVERPSWEIEMPPQFDEDE
jgi:U3 small nucleolar RNA-associated protein 4